MNLKIREFLKKKKKLNIQIIQTKKIQPSADKKSSCSLYFSLSSDLKVLLFLHNICFYYSKLIECH